MTNAFSGTSEKGDFSQALDQAIAAALAALPTDIVRWKLININGLYGGFVHQKQLTVTIEVEIPI